MCEQKADVIRQIKAFLCFFPHAFKAFPNRSPRKNLILIHVIRIRAVRKPLIRPRKGLGCLPDHRDAFGQFPVVFSGSVKLCNPAEADVRVWPRRAAFRRHFFRCCARCLVCRVVFLKHSVEHVSHEQRAFALIRRVKARIQANFRVVLAHQFQAEAVDRADRGIRQKPQLTPQDFIVRVFLLHRLQTGAQPFLHLGRRGAGERHDDECIDVALFFRIRVGDLIDHALHQDRSFSGSRRRRDEQVPVSYINRLFLFRRPFRHTLLTPSRPACLPAVPSHLHPAKVSDASRGSP